MARQRMIKPEFWSSDQITDCDAMARLLFIAMWNFADDGGVVPASPKRLKRQVFASDDVTIEQVSGWIDQLAANKLISRFSAEGENWIRILGWHHQKIQKPTFQYPRSKEFYIAAQERRRRFENRNDTDSSDDHHQGDDESATSHHQGDDSSPPNRSEVKGSEEKLSNDDDDDDDCDFGSFEPSPQSPPGTPEHASGPEAWNRARDACESIGMNSKRSGYVVDMARQKGFKPAEVVQATQIANDGRFQNPPGALEWWLDSHKQGRDVSDDRSWPVKVNRAPPPRQARVDPERERSKVLSEAVRLAKAGNLDDAVRFLTSANVDRKDWPVYVIEKLEKA